MSSRTVWTALGLVLSLSSYGPGLLGQVPRQAPDQDPWLSTPMVLTAGPLLSAALLPVDETIRSAFQAGVVQDSYALQDLAGGFRQLGEPITLGMVGGATALAWAMGEVHHRDAGFHTLQAFIAAGLVVTGMKTLAGRARPFRDPGPWEYAIGRGTRSHEFRSFPSGHTAQAFTLAASLTGELSEHLDWSPGWLRPTLCGAAAMTGISRMYDDRHWASDVVMGAVVGTLASRLVQRLNHR